MRKCKRCGNPISHKAKGDHCIQHYQWAGTGYWPEDICQMYAEGMSITEIVAKTGRMKHTIRRCLRAAGIQLRKNYRWSSALTLPTDPVDIGYLAGLVDGEGCIAIYTPTYSNPHPRGVVIVANTDRDLMDWLGAMGGCVSWNKGKRNKPCAQWTITRAVDVLKLCELILPHLRVKRAACRRVIRHVRAFLAA